MIFVGADFGKKLLIMVNHSATILNLCFLWQILRLLFNFILSNSIHFRETTWLDVTDENATTLHKQKQSVLFHAR